MRSHYETFLSLNTTMVAISFGTIEWAQAWLAETKIPFPLWLDPEKAAYQVYGLEHSLIRSWSLKPSLYYAKALLSGRKWRGIRGDSGQLGGDFIVDSNGIIRLAYRSHDPTDRPTIDYLLTTLRRLQSNL